MRNELSRYGMLAKRWMWFLLLGVVLCGGASYIVGNLMQPVYQASTLIILNLGSSGTTVYENTTASIEALPTYAQLLRDPTVLRPVVAQHKGLTLNELNTMISVKPQVNTQIIELDVESTDPHLAMQLANEVSQSLAQYTSTYLPANVQILPAQLPTAPVSPKPLLYAGIGALVGLGLALALIVIFEWMDDRLARPEEAQEVLGLDTLTIIPRLSRKERSMDAEKMPVLAEQCRVLCASLNAAQAIKPFKLVMVTSALPNEGKSTIAVNLASFLALAGKKVLLVDANLRHPVLDNHFQLDNEHGLSNLLLEEVQIEKELDGRLTEIPTLRVLTAGALTSNPPELLQSSSAHEFFDLMKKSSRFDYVIFDAAPLLPVADAQILASYIQATVLVIDASKTPRNMLLRAKSVLNRTQTRIIGVVVNKSSWSDYGDIRQYLRGIRHPEAKSDRTPRIPFNISTTPPMNGKGVVDPDMTVAISHQDKEGGEKP